MITPPYDPQELNGTLVHCRALFENCPPCTIVSTSSNCTEISTYMYSNSSEVLLIIQGKEAQYERRNLHCSACTISILYTYTCISYTGKLEAPKIEKSVVICSNRSISISWVRPATLGGIPISEYEVCDGQKCALASNTTLHWTASFPNVSVSTCEAVCVKVAAISEGHWSDNATLNEHFTEGIYTLYGKASQ